jgi:hypothetical protein
MSTKKKFNLVIPDDIHSVLRIKSFRDKVTMNDIISEMLDEEFKNPSVGLFNPVGTKDFKRTSLQLSTDIADELHAWSIERKVTYQQTITKIVMDGIKNFSEI